MEALDPEGGQRRGARAHRVSGGSQHWVPAAGPFPGWSASRVFGLASRSRCWGWRLRARMPAGLSVCPGTSPGALLQAPVACPLPLGCEMGSVGDRAGWQASAPPSPSAPGPLRQNFPLMLAAAGPVELKPALCPQVARVCARGEGPGEAREPLPRAAAQTSRPAGHSGPLQDLHPAVFPEISELAPSLTAEAAGRGGLFTRAFSAGQDGPHRGRISMQAGVMCHKSQE